MLYCYYLIYSMYYSFIFPYSQDLLTRHKVLVAEHLEQNYDAVSYMGLHTNDKYKHCLRLSMREQTHRYVSRSGISQLKAQRSSHITKNRGCLIGHTLVMKQEIKFSSGKVNNWKALSVSQLVSIQSSALCHPFPEAEGSLS